MLSIRTPYSKQLKFLEEKRASSEKIDELKQRTKAGLLAKMQKLRQYFTKAAYFATEETRKVFLGKLSDIHTRWQASELDALV